MELHIESFEGDIYLAYHFDGVHKQVLKSQHNQPLRFNSLNQIKEHCSDQHFHSVQLIHTSAYDEMCGLAGSKEAPAPLHLRW